MNAPHAAGWNTAEGRSRLPFASHLVGAVLFLLVIASQVFLVPVDLFVHYTYLQDQGLRFGVFGVVFYGFSLVLLRFYAVHPGWGVLYASGSWLLLIIAFYPTSPFGMSGMMRRVAADVPRHEATRQSVAQIIGNLQMAGRFGFVAVQAIFLWKAWRHLRSKAA